MKGEKRRRDLERAAGSQVPDGALRWTPFPQRIGMGENTGKEIQAGRWPSCHVVKPP
jgi:hypothetical protein